MAKLKLTFVYTPKWKANDKLDPKDQFRVTLRDYSERKRLELQSELAAIAPDEPITASAREQAESAVAYQKKDLEAREQIVKDYVVSVENLSIESEDGGEIKIKTGEDVVAHCWELGREIVERLFSGPREEELKN